MRVRLEVCCTPVGESASLLTPLAVVGDDVESVSRQLDALLSEPSEEMEVRRTLGRLETRILQELRQGDEPPVRKLEDSMMRPRQATHAPIPVPRFSVTVRAWRGVKRGIAVFGVR